LTVFAASSLTDAFGALSAELEVKDPSVRVVTTFAGSQVLRLQIEGGAPADVFASANREHMSALEAADLIRDRRALATNRLALIVPIDNPAKIERFEDIVNAQRLVVGTDHVPIGMYTAQLLDRLEPELARQVRASIVSKESTVRLVRAKVELGEADAAIVYAADAAASSRLRAIAIPDAPTASFSVGVLSRSERPELAQRWLDFVASETGRGILSRHGFAAP